MKRFVLLVAFALASSTLSAQTAVTLGSTINLGAIQGATKYQVQMQTNIGNTLAVSDPATYDPDGDKIVDVTPAANGTGSIGISVWLTGKGAGSYLIFSRSVDNNGIAGPWSPQEPVTYGGPPPPPITISALVDAFFEMLASVGSRFVPVA